MKPFITDAYRTIISVSYRQVFVIEFFFTFSLTYLLLNKRDKYSFILFLYRLRRFKSNRLDVLLWFTLIFTYRKFVVRYQKKKKKNITYHVWYRQARKYWNTYLLPRHKWRVTFQNVLFSKLYKLSYNFL